MPEEILLSTAYCPPAIYFSLIRNSDKVFIEREENYVRQTYRNRCKILTSAGILSLSVPVMKGNVIKAKVRDIRIDYSKRWQQVHLRALTSAYSRSPYFQFYSEPIMNIIQKKQSFLIDLNNELLLQCLGFLDMDKCIDYTSSFLPDTSLSNDFRYRISPGKHPDINLGQYIQVFGNKFVPGLSILDLIFNLGPESTDYL